MRGCPPCCGASTSAISCAAAARAPARVLTTCTSGGGSFLYVWAICSAEMPASGEVLVLATSLCRLLLLLLLLPLPAWSSSTSAAVERGWGVHCVAACCCRDGATGAPLPPAAAGDGDADAYPPGAAVLPAAAAAAVGRLVSGQPAAWAIGLEDGLLKLPLLLRAAVLLASPLLALAAAAAAGGLRLLGPPVLLPKLLLLPLPFMRAAVARTILARLAGGCGCCCADAVTLPFTLLSACNLCCTSCCCLLRCARLARSLAVLASAGVVPNCERPVLCADAHVLGSAAL